ncbi:tyrosine-type recombinase/integrase [Chloroflexota bacterium]
MRGHITKRGKDSYSIKVSTGKDIKTRKYKYQWVSVNGTKKEAEKRLSEMLNQLDNGTFMKPGKTTLAEYLERWLKDYAWPNLSPRGFERYAGIIRQHLISEPGSITLTQLKPEHLQQHYTTMLNNGLSAGTVRYHHAVLHVALQTAVKWGLVNRNVADAVDPPRIHRNEMQTWSEDEVSRFLEASKVSPYHELFFTALFTGMRRSELLGLAWQNVDFIFSQIYVNRSLHHLKDGSYVFTAPKSAKSRRTIALSPSAILLMHGYKEKQKLEWAMLGVPLKDDDLVFSTLEGKPLRPNTVTRAWTMLAIRAGVKVIRLHDARHTHASLMLKQGVHPKIVQERLGHSSVQMTLDTYSHVAPGLQEAAAAGFDKMVFPRRENVAVENH